VFQISHLITCSCGERRRPLVATGRGGAVGGASASCVGSWGVAAPPAAGSFLRLHISAAVLRTSWRSRRGSGLISARSSPLGTKRGLQLQARGTDHGLDSTYAVRWGNGSHLLVASPTTARSRDQSPVLKNHSRLEGISCACDR
jgi:hypothetical protein